VKLEIAHAPAMEQLGERLAQAASTGCRIYLQGDLGVGKTTLVRGFLRGLGYTGRVKSPTYTLVEPYELQGGRTLYHLDLYRLSDPEELEWIGVRDLFQDESLCLVEWPEHGRGVLPAPDLLVDMRYADHGRSVRLHALTGRGGLLVAGHREPHA
jgi:tRNA threonylcarbamoyladenosine biosynthesis protein TsaE